MLLENIYQIRGSTGVGPFGTDWNLKFLLVFVALFFCIYDSQTKKRNDYWWVFLFGSGLWGGAETMLQLLGIRQLATPYLFGWAMPLWFSLPIQGIVEGGLIAVGCLYFSDRIIDKQTRTRTIILYLVLMGILMAAAFIRPILEHYPGPDYGGNVVSRRNMFNPLPVLLLCVMTAISLIFMFVVKSDIRNRTVLYFLLMVIFGACWTFGEWAAGTRWIEVGIPPNYQHAPPIIEFLALTWDVIVEIAFAYTPFFVLPVTFHLIKPLKIQSKKKTAK